MSEIQKKQPTLYICTYCNYTTNTNAMYEKHCNTKIHINIVKEFNNKQTKNIPPKKEKVSYNCELCNFKTNNKFNYNTHLLSTRHKQKEDKDFKKPIRIHTCENCNRRYDKYKSYWMHKKSCTFQGSQESKPETIEEIERCVGRKSEASGVFGGRQPKGVGSQIDMRRPPSSASATTNETDTQEESEYESEEENIVYTIDDRTGDEYCYESKYTNKTKMEEYEDIYNRMYNNYNIYSEIDTDTEYCIDLMNYCMELNKQQMLIEQSDNFIRDVTKQKLYDMVEILNNKNSTPEGQKQKTKDETLTPLQLEIKKLLESLEDTPEEKLKKEIRGQKNRDEVFEPLEEKMEYKRNDGLPNEVIIED